jgi:hypothetical protein
VVLYECRKTVGLSAIEKSLVQMKIKISSLLMEAGVELQQAAIALGRLLPRTAGDQPGYR